MAVTISWWAGSTRIADEQGSGIGLFGADYGRSIVVGAWNERTFVTSSAGTGQGAENPNCRYLASGTVILGSAGSGIGLQYAPNSQATINIRVESDTDIQITSATLYGYDRVSVNNPPSGISLKAFELVHPSASQSVVGSGDTVWTTLLGSGATLSLAPSPGSGGLYAGNGSNSVRPDKCHDFYVGISASPSTVGSKQGALYLSLEYL